MKERIIIGTRGSKLAITQTGIVADKIRAIYPWLDIEIQKVLTTGDRDRQTRLEQLGEAVFVKELEQSLLNGTIDIAVHSLKDLPTEIPEGLKLAAVTGRDDPRDAVVARMKLTELPEGSLIGTDSLRRSVQLRHYYPHLKIGGLRGNVDTRLKKVASGELDGIIVAAAGMNRLGLQDKITEYLPLDQFLPSVGQGALAVETREDDCDIDAITAQLNDSAARQSVNAERAFLLSLGGGCRAPIGALGAVSGNVLSLDGMVASLSSGKIIRLSTRGDAKDAESIGRQLAEQLLKMGAEEFIDEVRGR